MGRGIAVRLGPDDRELLEAVNRLLVETNQNPKPFSRAVIIEKARRGKPALNAFGVAR